jgi:hypothetical protein
MIAEAEPVTYAFSGVASVAGHGCDNNDSVNGTITLDFGNANPAQSKGSVGSPTGWTSVSTAKTALLFVPYVFTMTVCGNGGSGFFLNPNTSSVTVGPGGISGQFDISHGSPRGNVSFSNPSGAVSVNGMPLFDSPGTGSGLFGGPAEAIDFIITSMTLVSPTVAKQIDLLVTESAGAPSLIDIANTAQAQVQSACISLENFVLRVKTKEAAKQLTEHRANQLGFDAKTVEMQTGC